MHVSSADGRAESALIGLQNPAAARRPWVTGSIAAADRYVPAVSTRLSRADVMGGWRVRWDIGRRNYSILPGLYAIGRPTPESPVLVTANYKLTFDALRSRLAGIDAWILALDTRGINVWCAAGKGTFGTRELIDRITTVKLSRFVSHRTVILPQLGAPGVAAHEVLQATGFRVKYGPVRAADIPAYLEAGQKKDDAMRKVTFTLRERMTIAPAELAHSWPFLLSILGGSALLALPVATGYFARFLQTLLPLLGSVLVGTLAFPALLPWVPFRAFALKGALLGAIWAAGAALAAGVSPGTGAGIVLIGTPVTAFLSMNFTGSSTFTCQPGAALEVRRGLVPMIVSLCAGIGLAIAAKLAGL
jgi:hypothetical protein